MKKITLKMLKKNRACNSQVRKFARRYPNGFTVTAANVTKAELAEFDIYWAGCCLMNGKARRRFLAKEHPLFRKLWNGGTQEAYAKAGGVVFADAWKMQCEQDKAKAKAKKK